MEAYKVYMIPVVSCVAQLDDPPEGWGEIEDQALQQLLLGPFCWPPKPLAQNHTVIGAPVEFPPHRRGPGNPFTGVPDTAEAGLQLAGGESEPGPGKAGHGGGGPGAEVEGLVRRLLPGAGPGASRWPAAAGHHHGSRGRGASGIGQATRPRRARGGSGRNSSAQPNAYSALLRASGAYAPSGCWTGSSDVGIARRCPAIGPEWRCGSWNPSPARPRRDASLLCCGLGSTAGAQEPESGTMAGGAAQVAARPTASGIMPAARVSGT